MTGSLNSSLKVIVKTANSPLSPYTWVIIDDRDGRELRESPGTYRTPGLAWQAGTDALATRLRPKAG